MTWIRSGEPTPAGRAALGINTERGAALILVMVILVLLTFIGMASLATTSTEVFIAGNYRQSREAFQTAEGMLQGSLPNTTVFNLVDFSGVGDSNPLPAIGPDTDPSSHTTVSASGSVMYIGTGVTATNSKQSVKMNGAVKANYFIMDATGTSSLGASSQQELVLSKTVPAGGG